MTDAIEKLLPHRAPMRFIDALIGCTETTATATACFRAGDFAVANGVVLETALVECVAQTVAAALGSRAQTNGAGNVPANGMLIAVTNYRIAAPAPLGKVLQITITERKRLGRMTMISSSIACEGMPIAAGDLTLYV